MEDDPPPQVPEWVVTYGDMMSLLLTFFIMLVSLSEIKGDQQYRAMIQAIESYLGYNSSPLSPPGDYFPANSEINKMVEQHLGSHSNTQKGKGGVKRPSTPGNDVRVNILREGESVAAGQPLTFIPDQFTFQDQHHKLLDQIAVIIAGKPNKIEVRAWSHPFSGDRIRSQQDRLNAGFDLAEQAYNYLLTKGIEEQNLRITVDLGEGLKGIPPEFQQKNLDLISVVILDEFSKDRIGRPEDYQ